MKKAWNALALCTALPTAAFADDRIVSPPSDLELAYKHPRLALPLGSRALSVARDGAVASYAVQMPVEAPASESQMFLSSGAPRFTAEGTKIMLVDISSRQSWRICPSKGNDWDPMWSPDGSKLAFYSDRDGEARLWLYERRDQSCRRISDLTVKSLPWAHEEPRWSPDGSQVYFATWPDRGPGSAAQARVAVSPSDAPAMRAGEINVYRHDPNPTGPITGIAQPRSASFEQRCARGTQAYSSASLAVATIGTAGGSRLLVDAVTQSSEHAANRHYPTPYQRISASGRWLTYVSTACTRVGEVHQMVQQLYALPVAGGTPVLIADNLRPSVGGAEEILKYRWSPVADELVFVRDGQLWRVAFAADGPAAPQRMAEELGELSFGIHWYSEDGSMLLVANNPVRVGRANTPYGFDIDLAIVPVAGGTPIRIAIDRGRWAIEGVVARDDRALLQPAPTSFRLHARDKITGEAAILTFDWRTKQMQESWRGRARLTNIEAAGPRHLIGLYEDFRTPTNLFMFSKDLTKGASITNVSPQLSVTAASQAELFDTVIPQSDGTLRTVRTAVLLPPGAKRGDRLPAVVWLYPSYDLTMDLSRFGAAGAVGDPAYPLTSRGYAVILTNVAIGPGDKRGHVIDEIMDSLMPQVHHAADLGYVDIKRLAIRGQSFGGFATAAVVARTNLFRAAIPSSAPYDLGGYFSDVNFIFGEAFDNSRWSETGQPRLGQPVWSDPLRYIENSPYYLADRIQTPMLIIQGTADVIGIREAGKFFAALRRLNKPVELALYEGGSHAPSAWEAPLAIDQMARTIEFLQRHIGPGWTARKK